MTPAEHMKTELTRRSDYLVNWHRIGNLFFSNHHYSAWELAERSFIIAAMATCGFLAMNMNKSDKRGYASFACGATLGFLIAHTVVLLP